MGKSSVRGLRSARVLLRASTALMSGALLTQTLPALAQTVVGPTSGPYYGEYNDASGQPKAADGPSSCDNDFSPCIGDDSQTGKTGAQGTQAGDLNIAFAPNTNVYGQPGQVSVTISANGGKGGDGGDGGALTGGVGYSNGGNAGAGGQAGNVTFEQRGEPSVTSGITGADKNAVLLRADGGTGGDGGNNYVYGKGGAGGVGGYGATVTFTQDSNTTITGTQPGVTAVVLESDGGQGGDSPDARTHTSHAYANNGATGGSGGTIHATISGTIVSQGSGVVATSAGGNGGNGGMAQSDTADSTAGMGGDGGGSNDIMLTLAGGSITSTGASGPATGTTQNAQGGTITFSAPTAALLAITQGGLGGSGNGTGTSFGKGVGGSGGDAGGDANTFVNNQAGAISTTGYAAAGLVAQSIGGHGGNGGYGGGVFVAKGGSGATGGDGGDALAQTNGGTIKTIGDSSLAMLAQSIGGGGGFGAGASVSTTVVGVSLGGSGADGGNGGTATIYNGTPNEDFSQFTDGSVVSTQGYGAHAMAAQSIGGGGGAAGDATATVVGGILSVAIGGNAGTGGDSAVVNVQNGGVVQTAGDDAYGMIGQSVGGGGGDGGAAYSLDIGAQLTVSTAVGGNGGNGGNGYSASDSTHQGVNMGNEGQIVTSGGNSYGMIAQSVGGGGGTGGTSFARTIQVYNDPEYPSLTLNVSLGGSGGSGGGGGNVGVANEGAVLTSGAGAYAVLAQSIGGGGGAGGDADSLNQAYNASTFTVTTTIGGNGGKGGDAGTVFVGNTGFINTAGDSATGVYAQSVGGGGGSGGSGSADTGSYNDNEKPYSFQFTLTLGGSGGASGDGKYVSVQNFGGGIATYGHGSEGIFAQSVGGGGGDAGNASAKGGGGANNFNIGVGGAGGGGGIGGGVNIDNRAAILTTGSDSAAIYAQSVGGGGGIAGSGTVGDGTAPQKTIEQFLANGLGIGQNVVDRGNGIYELGQKGQDEYDDINKLKDLANYFDQNSEAEKVADGDESEGSKINVNIGGGIGGTGGNAGNGGTVTVTNTGAIATLGAASEAIFAQSVGGGGGHGGISGGEAAAFTLVTVNLAGNGGTNGSGGTITVSNNGTIATGGNDAIGILAQSLGGGGGVAGVMTQNDTTGESETGDIPDTTLIPITLSGDTGDSAGTQSPAQKVEVDLTGGSIITQGRDSYGVLAQSIGGGGGLVLGVNGEADQKFFGSNQSAGAGGEIDVSLSGGTKIETHGDGAVGILAQSIGGGGGLVGGMSAVDLSTGPRTTFEGFLQHAGQGGNINIDVEPGTRIDTYGTRAHGIFVQSVGAGGGVFGIQGGTGYTMAGRGACPQAPCSGMVTVNADGFVQAHGPDSWGIYAQAQGDGTSGVTINLLKGTGIVDGTAGGIYIDSRFGTNTVNNIGYISGGNGVAIATNGAATLNSGVPSGGIVTISGNILSSGSGWNITNNTSSRIYTNTLIQSNAFVNHGEIWLGNLDGTNVTEIASNLNSGDGRLVVGVDFAAGKADTLKVDGTATLGQILVNPITVQAGTVTFATASGGFDLTNAQVSNFVHNADDSLTPVTPYLYQYLLSRDGPNTLQIIEKANLAAAANPSVGAFNTNQQAVAGHLQSLFDAGPAGGDLTLASTVLNNVTTPAQYTAALDSLGAHTLGVAAASRGAVDRSFSGLLMNCPAFEDDSVQLVEKNCFWARVGGGIVDTKGDAISTGFDSTNYIYQLGGQKEIGSGWFLGGSLGYENSSTRADSGYATVKGDSALAGIMLKYQSGPLIVSAAAAGGFGWFKSVRQIVIGDDRSTATASPKTGHVGAHVKASYDLLAGRVYFRPQINLDATYVHFDGFVETGSPFALDVGASHHWFLSANPALEIGTRLGSGSTIVRPYVRGGAVFYNDRDWRLRARIAGTSGGLDPFVADTSLPETAATVEAGLDIYANGNFNLKVSYDGEFARRYRSHSGFARLNYLFR